MWSQCDVEKWYKLLILLCSRESKSSPAAVRGYVIMFEELLLLNICSMRILLNLCLTLFECALQSTRCKLEMANADSNSHGYLFFATCSQFESIMFCCSHVNYKTEHGYSTQDCVWTLTVGCSLPGGGELLTGIVWIRKKWSVKNMRNDEQHFICKLF